MKYLDFPIPDNFIKEAKILGIKNISLIAETIQTTTQDKYKVPIMLFKMVATATKEGLDYIIRYQERIGSDVAYFDERMKELTLKTQERLKGFSNALKDNGFEVQEAVWGFK